MSLEEGRLVQVPGLNPSLEWPMVRWVAFADMYSIPELGRPLRYGVRASGKLAGKVQLYYQARFRHPNDRYRSIHRWEPVEPEDVAAELGAAVRAGYDVGALRQLVERKAGVER